MKRTIFLLIILFAGVLQAQAQLSVRAASEEPVPGWERMQSEVDRPIWVSPTVSLTAADFESLQPATDANGRRFVAVVLTDAGAKKMRELSIAQLNKSIALVLDGKVIWAPKVRSEIGKEAEFTGNGPNGIAEELVQRIVQSIR
jgi:preprotein translocase subunit SecD